MTTRRELLAAALMSAVPGAIRPTEADRKVRVVVWDERQPAQKQAYSNFLGNQIADYLRECGPADKRTFEVTSVGLDDSDQGLPAPSLDNADVLIWWGHQRHDEVKDELVKLIADRVQAGRLAFIGLHSAHWSKPFMALMNARAVQDALASLPAAERGRAEVKTIPAEKRIARRDEPLTPSFTRSGSPDHPILEVKLPSCVFPFVAAEGKPSHIRVVAPNHPLVKGMPAKFDIPQTECYGGPFHVPKPDVQLLDETWDNGERFPAGCYWTVGKGRVFYFRPGHETYPIYKQPSPLRIIENAARWMGTQVKR